MAKLFVISVSALVALKMFFPARWHALKERVDRVVNILLVLLCVSYGVQIALRLWH